MAKVLVIGSGGREHAIAWKLMQSKDVTQVYTSPGNAGTPNNVDINTGDFDGLAYLVEQEKIDLTVVGPEQPLAEGIVDYFNRRNLPIFGPTQAAARIESSKVFAKDFMRRYKIPTGEFFICYSPESAVERGRHFLEMDNAVVVKADGLADGKGVIVCDTRRKLENTVNDIMVKKQLGDAGNKVVVEQFLEGEEASFIGISDGSVFTPFLASQDHKPVCDNDKGPNTGGMGAYAPAPVVTLELHQQIMDGVMYPAIQGMRKEGTPYKGFLYAGLMIVDGNPYVLEFNCRMGDPEAQPILPLLKTDFYSLLNEAVNEGLGDIELEFEDKAACCVVMASGGYPGKYNTGYPSYPIYGLEDVAKMDDVIVFHAGTKRVNEKIITSGGRVLGVTGIGDSIADAIKKTYAAVERIEFKDMHYRTDIGKKALR